MHWLYYAILLLILLCGLLLNVLTLPGNWLMLAGVAIYAWVTGIVHGGLWSLLALLILAVVAEVVEASAAGKGARKVGGGRTGSFGALIGGVLGGIFLTGVVPIGFPLSTLVGILIGTFVGAMAGELLVGKNVGRSALIGVGAAKGRVMGTLMKFLLGCVIAVMSLVVAFPWPSHTKAATRALTAPATRGQ